MVGGIEVYLGHLASKNKLIAHPNVELNQIYEKSVQSFHTSYIKIWQRTWGQSYKPFRNLFRRLAQSS
jgi:hypothetical protein